MATTYQKVDGPADQVIAGAAVTARRAAAVVAGEVYRVIITFEYLLEVGGDPFEDTVVFRITTKDPETA